jgi:hypothetical protein
MALVAGAAVIGAGRDGRHEHLRGLAAISRRAKLDRAMAHQEQVRARAVTELLREVMPTGDQSSPELARALGAGLDRVYFRLETRAFADDMDVDQTLRRLWGQVYTEISSGRAIAQVEYAEVSLRTGLERLRTLHGAEHPEIAATMHELGAILLVRKRYAEAERVARQALAMRINLLTEQHPDVPRSRALLAQVLMAMQRGTGGRGRGTSRAGAGRGPVRPPARNRSPPPWGRSSRESGCTRGTTRRPRRCSEARCGIRCVCSRRPPPTRSHHCRSRRSSSNWCRTRRSPERSLGRGRCPRPGPPRPCARTCPSWH